MTEDPDRQMIAEIGADGIDAQAKRAARRRAHNAHALERCNAMGRTAGSILWQPLQKRDGKWFMPDGAALPEPPIEWRSEKLETILDEMDAREAVVPAADWGKAYVETLDVEKWKADVDAQFDEGGAMRSMPPSRLDKIRDAIDDGRLPAYGPATISLEDLEKAISAPPKDVCDALRNSPEYLARVNAEFDSMFTEVPETFKQYRRTNVAEMRPYVPGEDIDYLSVSVPDFDAGSPKLGDMIARNPKNHADQWLVAEQYFKDNFEPIE